MALPMAVCTAFFRSMACWVVRTAPVGVVELPPLDPLLLLQLAVALEFGRSTLDCDWRSLARDLRKGLGVVNRGVYG